ncbi:MAG: FAD-dependent oxidoreductase [Treponema sp.]|jgi:NADPH-dependent 2,4-dienoyl-CoA reductase/sulfur reductase-like enzyme|nr:FAD-dependent oxidoreductase [Treponema sp.]
MNKIVIIGANHAGIAAANTILDNYPENKLVIFDSSSSISYLGCGTALYIGRQISGTEGLFYTSKENLAAKKATVFMETAVKSIDFDKKEVYAKGKDGEEITESYDKLILATGSLPIAPPIKGLETPNVHFVKTFQDGQIIDALLDKPEIKAVAVVGAGYIGVELAEAVKRRGKDVMLFEAAATSLSTYYDEWFTGDMDKVLADNGVQLHFGELVQEIEGTQTQHGDAVWMGKATQCSPNEGNGKAETGGFALANPAGGNAVKGIVTNKAKYPADAVIMAIGFKPNTTLGNNILETLPNGAYKVDCEQRTSMKDVFAVGDCASVRYNATQSDAYIALATNAVRSGIIAGHNACGTALESPGVQGSNGICIFGYKMVSTGLNTSAAEKSGYMPECAQFEDLQKPAFIKEDNHKVKLRIVYDKNTRRILGAQMASFQDMSMGIHLFSLAIEEKLTIDKFKLLDIFFLPHFNQPYNYITMAALSAK